MENLAQLLHEHMEAHHRGQRRAIPREELRRNFVCPLAGEMDDREFRKLYGQLPVAGCARGLFIPATKQELKEFYEYLLKKGMSKEAAMKRVEIILKIYPKLDWRVGDERQGVLFG
jgi:5-formaminoimidazole-4-carboxamide-1-beta-D-ribofuranosyl 5'-monophosphate synthetase